MKKSVRIVILGAILLLICFFFVINNSGSAWKNTFSFDGAFIKDKLYYVNSKQNTIYDYDISSSKKSAVYKSDKIFGLINWNDSLVFAEINSVIIFDPVEKCVRKEIPLIKTNAIWDVIRQMSETEILLCLYDSANSSDSYYILDLADGKLTPYDDENAYCGIIHLNNRSISVFWSHRPDPVQGNYTQEVVLSDTSGQLLFDFPSSSSITDFCRYKEGLLLQVNIASTLRYFIFNDSSGTLKEIFGLPDTVLSRGCCLNGHFIVAFDPYYGGRVIVYELYEIDNGYSVKQRKIM